ncbi:YqgE/AlgH family protein [Cutibacterium sp. V970]|uniref:YqgE/AlgH family protein n=1 Tax=Cutibacterium sp. V970 TaxID=3446481 RepID=UPI003EDEFD21
MGVVILANPLKAGDLLLASRHIDEGCFCESVVYLIDVAPDGVLGVIVNQPCSAGTLRSQLPDWEPLATPPQDLFFGGPMSPSGAICLARVQRSSEEPPGWRRVDGLTGLLHLDTPTELVDGAFTDLRVFAGYAGWEPGQLEAELIRGDWIRAVAHPEDIFSSEPRALWRAVLHRQNGAAAVLATATDTPTLN